MEAIQETDEEEGTNNFEKQFASYVKAGLGPENLEEAYLKVHEAIRANPAPKHAQTNKEREYEADGKTKKPNAKRAASLKQFPKQRSFKKRCNAQRKDTVRQKKEAAIRKFMAENEDDE